MRPAGGPEPDDDPPVRYEFLLAGRLSDRVIASFPELRARSGPAGGTVMFGEVSDAAHLRGLLDRFQNLAVSVVEMRQLPD